MKKVIRYADEFSDFVAIITYTDTNTQIPTRYSFNYTLKENVINDEFNNIDPDKVIGGLENTHTNTSNSNDESIENTTSGTSAPNNSEIVYWTLGGRSFHRSKSCHTLARSKTILEGTLQ